MLKNRPYGSLYYWYEYLASYLQSPLLLIIRVWWGWQFFISGMGKFSDIGPVINYFTQLSIPFPIVMAWVAASIECIGGLLFLVGFFSRFVALLLSALMVGAYLTAEWDSVKHLFTNPDQFTSTTPFLFLLASLIVLAFGPGIFSLDGLYNYFGPKKLRKSEQPPTNSK